MMQNHLCNTSAAAKPKIIIMARTKHNNDFVGFAFSLQRCKRQKSRSHATWESFFCLLPMLGGNAHFNCSTPLQWKHMIVNFVENLEWNLTIFFDSSTMAFWALQNAARAPAPSHQRCCKTNGEPPTGAQLAHRCVRRFQIHWIYGFLILGISEGLCNQVGPKIRPQDKSNPRSAIWLREMISLRFGRGIRGRGWNVRMH